MRSAFILAFIILAASFARAQVNPALRGGVLNTIYTAVPFLTIAPDARSAGMGDLGVASEADVSSQHWNVAKYAFAEGRGGFGLNFTPWLRNLIPDIYLAYLSGYYRINEKNVLSSSFRYFSLGEIIFTNIQGQVTGSSSPVELAADVGYARLFTDHLSGGIVFRYIHSNLTAGNSTAAGEETFPGTSIAADLGLYYQNDFPMGQDNVHWALGLNISNIGTPISYTKDATPTPIPTNLRMGGRIGYHIREKHAISLLADVNKLLVPTSPVYGEDSITGEPYVIRGKEPPESVVAGMFQSFYDAPGVQVEDGSYSVFKEEMHEISYSLGLEYNFNRLLLVRTGYFHEHSTKGNRQYVTAGLGLKNSLFSLDLAYIFPTNGQDSPLANTYRITFTAEIGRISPGQAPE